MRLNDVAETKKNTWVLWDYFDINLRSWSYTLTYFHCMSPFIMTEART